MASSGPVPPPPPGTAPRPPPPPPPTPRGGRGGFLLWLGLGVVAAGGYYLYTAGGNTVDARRKAQTDARKSLETTLDGVERVGDKIDRAYYDVKSQAESIHKNTKTDIEKEYEKENMEIGKQVEGWADKLDGKVEEAASKTREGISNWRKK